MTGKNISARGSWKADRPCSVDSRDYCKRDGILNNFTRVTGKKPDYSILSTWRCFLISSTGNWGSVHSIVNELPWIFLSALDIEYRGLYVSNRNQTSTREQPRRETYREDLNSFGLFVITAAYSWQTGNGKNYYFRLHCDGNSITERSFTVAQKRISTVDLPSAL